MRVKILKDVTITVCAGQTVEVPQEQARHAVKLGYAEEEKTAPKGGKKTKK